MDGSPQTQACIKEKDQGSQDSLLTREVGRREGRAQTSSYTCSQVDRSAAEGGPKDSADDKDAAERRSAACQLIKMARSWKRSTLLSEVDSEEQ